MDKKAQAQIITVVLIILLVLAAIVIVWQVIRSTVQESAEEVAGGTECITMALSIVDPVNAGAIMKVSRGVGSGSLDKIRIIIGGATEATDWDASGLDELETSADIAISAVVVGDVIEIAGVLANGKLCDIADTATVI